MIEDKISMSCAIDRKGGEKDMPADIKFLTIEDVSEMLQVTRTTVYNLKKQGMPFIKLGKNIRFDQKEVVDWVRSNRCSTEETEK